MNGEIVSGSSGAIAPKSFQFLVKPSLIELACSVDVVRLYKTAMELASWGQSVVVSLSRYMPAEGSQNTSLKRVFSEDALDDQLDTKVDAFIAEASSVAVINVYHRRNSKFRVT